MRSTKSHKHSSKVERRRNAQHQIDVLIGRAILERRDAPDLALRHASLAWRMATRFNLKLNGRRMLFCHSCKEPIIPGYDSRYRIRSHELIISCLKCGKVYRKILQTAV